MNKLKILLELVWWVVTAIIVFAVLYPIQKNLSSWPFQTWNIIYIVGLITLARYIFLLNHTFIARLQYVKAGLVIAMIPLTFMFISGVNQFMTFIEEQTWESLTGHLPVVERMPIEGYTWNEMLFFGVGCMISAPVFAVRLFISIWWQRNRNNA